MPAHTEVPLSCSECGEVGTYIRGQESDVVCRECGNEVSFVDFKPDAGEVIHFNDAGTLCVYIPKD